LQFSENKNVQIEQTDKNNLLSDKKSHYIKSAKFFFEFPQKPTKNKLSALV